MCRKSDVSLKRLPILVVAWLYALTMYAMSFAGVATGCIVRTTVDRRRKRVSSHTRDRANEFRMFAMCRVLVFPASSVPDESMRLEMAL